jgi:transcriptional regulator with XRE-family HTH domain
MHDDIAGEPGGLSGGPEALTSVGDIICELRSNLGWSQGRLAEELGKVSGHPSITREYVSRWEHGRKIPGPFWIGHLAAVFQVPRWVMEGHVRRRDMLRLTGVAAIGAVAGVPAGSLDGKGTIRVDRGRRPAAACADPDIARHRPRARPPGRRRPARHVAARAMGRRRRP